MKQFLVRRGTLLALFVSALSFSNCQKSTGGKNYRYNGVMDVDGWNRSYLLNLPPNFYDTTGLPLVILLHGFAGTAKQAEADYGVTDKGNAGHFIVVYPEGIQSDGPYRLRSWDAGNCCFVAQSNGINDVHFISNLIDYLVANYKVDPKKVYVAGMSNGAMMAYSLACDLSGKIAAITSVSGTLIASSPCTPSRSVPILEIHSSQDSKVPFNGGYGMDGVWFPAVDSGLNVWAALDTCGAPTATQYTGYTLTEWKNNSGNVAIDCYLTQDGGHSWPGGLKPRVQADPPSVYLNATDLMWDFFQRYTLP
ncbi:alpha/beta hydrolase family esterase [Puia sp.]|uniref:extracellular catalytic domain type 1 short-chain-length polyhydroxyalkanoate depolymerase n=1 Tax=Puia sp. TaxID=2045100 RepID=UPI002F3F59E6